MGGKEIMYQIVINGVVVSEWKSKEIAEACIRLLRLCDAKVRKK
jgi:hypothetical protein